MATPRKRLDPIRTVVYLKDDEPLSAVDTRLVERGYRPVVDRDPDLEAIESSVFPGWDLVITWAIPTDVADEEAA